MKNQKNVSRRNFLTKSVAATGIVSLGMNQEGYAIPSSNLRQEDISPREPLVVTVSNEGLDSSQDIRKQMLQRLENIAAIKPDIIALPETFATPFSKLPDCSESLPGPTTKAFSSFAKKNNSYIICPLYTRREGKIYNTAVLIDRQGEIRGTYDKIHPTERECDHNITPGGTNRTFKTDFGTIGILICFDVNWLEEWQKLQEMGAEIIFWISAYPGGRMLSSYAWIFKCYVVGSSLTRDPALIYDMSGDKIAQSGSYDHWASARLNLEKVLCEVDFNAPKVKSILKKYGSKVRIKYFHDEDWMTIESRSPELHVKDLMKEFDLTSHQDYIARAGRHQNKFR